MTTPLEKLERRVAELERASEEIRDATRDAHEATKLLRHAEKDVRDLLRDEPLALVNAAIEEAVRKGLEQYAETMNEARDSAVARVTEEFTKLAAVYLGTEVRPGETFDELAARARRPRPLPPLKLTDEQEKTR